MARHIWNGAVSFGLLHAPVALHTATRHDEIDFDWLQRGTFKPVGYKRVVKESGKEVAKEDIVKGIRQEDGKYVVLTDEEIRAAHVKTTHTIDIVSFVEAEDLSFVYFETPYYLAPTKGGEKVYALLREALIETKKIGIALIVLHNKQHLAALIPTPTAIVLNTLRWAEEVKSPDDLDLPAEGPKTAGIKSRELEMAVQLIDSMAEDWRPEAYKDTFRHQILALAAKKVKEGKAHVVEEVEISDEGAGEEIATADLMALLKQSLRAPRVTRSLRQGAKSPTRRKAAAKTRARSKSTSHHSRRTTTREKAPRSVH